MSIASTMPALDTVAPAVGRRVQPGVEGDAPQARLDVLVVVA